MKRKLSSLFVCLLSLVIASCHTQQTVTEQPIDLTNVAYKGGDGKSAEDAVLIIGAKDEHNGIAAEYAWITKQHGERNSRWKYGEQSTVMHDGKRMDVIMIHTIPANITYTYYFDISDFYGK